MHVGNFGNSISSFACPRDIHASCASPAPNKIMAMAETTDAISSTVPYAELLRDFQQEIVDSLESASTADLSKLSRESAEVSCCHSLECQEMP